MSAHEATRWRYTCRELEVPVKLTALLLLAACGGQTPTAQAPSAPATQPAPEEAAPAAEPTPAPEAGVANAAPAGLPDLSANLPHGKCESVVGNSNVTGADTYWVGEFTINGNSVTGFERWHIFANSKLQASSHWGVGPSCVLEFKVTGSTQGTGSCSGCDLGIKIHAEPNLSSNCPKELVFGRDDPHGGSKKVGGHGAPYDVNYGIQRKPDGTAVVFFADSGKRLAQGYHKGSGVTYVTDHKCSWF